MTMGSFEHMGAEKLSRSEVFPLARLLPRRKPPQRVSPLCPPAVTRVLIVGGMGGVVRLPL